MYIKYVRICKILFSWLGQKVNKKLDALWPQDDAASRQDIQYGSVFSILIEFEAIEYSYLIFDSVSKFLGYLIFCQISDNMNFSFRMANVFVYSQCLPSGQCSCRRRLHEPGAVCGCLRPLHDMCRKP